MILINGNIAQLNGNFGLKLETETISFQNRVSSNSGNSLSAKEIQSVDWLIKTLKKEGLWSLLIVLYPFLGGNGSTGSKNSFAVNLVSSSYTMTPTSVTDAMCTSNGYTGNGSSSYWDTGLFDNTITLNSFTAGAYVSVINDLNIIPFPILIGAQELYPSKSTALVVRQTISALEAYSENTGNFVVASTGIKGLNLGSKNGTSLFYFSSDGVITTSTGTTTDNRSNKSFIIGASNTNAGANNFSSNRFDSPFIGNAISQSQAVVMNRILKTFETMLGRQV